MQAIRNDQLIFTFPEVHPDARLIVEFQRTLRIPDGGREMPRLPSLGRYPLFPIEEHRDRVPRHWLEHGGGMLPMYQSEAMWLSFQPAYSMAARTFYPFAVKVGVGDLDAITGSRRLTGLHRWPQDYLVIHDHSWLGGFVSGNGAVHQFAAMPLGSGYFPSQEEGQGRNRFGRVRLDIVPMCGDIFAARYLNNATPLTTRSGSTSLSSPRVLPSAPSLQPDALIQQRREEGLFPLEDWHQRVSESYCVHLANSLHWCAITGSPPVALAPHTRTVTGLDRAGTSDPGAGAVTTGTASTRPPFDLG